MSLQAMLMALADFQGFPHPWLLPQGGQAQDFSHRGNPDFVLPEQGLVDPLRVVCQSANFLPKDSQGKQWFAFQMVARRAWQWHTAHPSLKTDSLACFGIWPSELRWALGNEQLRVQSRIRQELLDYSFTEYLPRARYHAISWEDTGE